MRARVLCLVMVVALGLSSTACSNNEDVGTEVTVTYCTPGGVGQELDVYTPVPAPTSPVPAVVYVHGGGWISGNQNFSPFLGLIEKQVVGSGDIFVSVNYRLAPKYRWPAQIEDVKCAVRFLRFDAKKLEIDPTRIGAIGDSAGGQLVGMLGLAGPKAGFDVGQYLNESSAVEGVVDLYGPADLTTSDWNGDAVMHVFANDTFGQSFGLATPELVAASPVAYVTQQAPPFLMIEGTDDAVVPPDESKELATRLSADGDSVSLVMVKYAGHGLIQVGHRPIVPGLTQLAKQITSFLTGDLRGGG